MSSTAPANRSVHFEYLPLHKQNLWHCDARGYIALVYILDRATLRRLTYNNFRAFFMNSSDAVKEYPAVDSVLTDSVGGGDSSQRPSKQTVDGAGIGDTMQKTAYSKFNDF